MFTTQKKEGFKGQRSIVLPEFIIWEMRRNDMCKNLFLTDIGYYPSALNHSRSREGGCNQFILIYCVNGKGWISVDGKKRKVIENQYFVIPENTPHAYASSKDVPWSIYWVHFEGLLASHFFDSPLYGGILTQFVTGHSERRLQLFEEIIQNLEMGYSKEYLEYANICLWHFLASFKYNIQFSEIRAIKESGPVETTILYMRENMHEKLSLENLATETGFSVSHLSLLFRRKTGRSPMDYLINLRMHRACQYLDNTNYQIKEIAQKVAYDDPFHFSRIFKKIIGQSPSEYRKMEKG